MLAALFLIIVKLQKGTMKVLWKFLQLVVYIPKPLKMCNIFVKQKEQKFVIFCTTRIPEMLGRFLNLNKMKTKRISNHMSQYFK